MLRTMRSFLLLTTSVVCVQFAAPGFAQRSVAGVDDEEDPDGDDDEPREDEKKSGGGKSGDTKAGDKKSGGKKAADKKADDKKADDKKADDKKADDKKADDKKAGDKKADDKKAGDKKAGDKKADDKKADDKKADDKRLPPSPKATPDDVLGETPEERQKREAEDAARRKAEAVAAEEAAKAEAERVRLEAEKKAMAEQRRAQTRDQRLSSARKFRVLQRAEGPYRASVVLEPGAPGAGTVLEVRLEIGRALAVPDPKFGNREPLKNLSLLATLVDQSGKKGESKQFVVHPLGAPGLYGFHWTPPQDGVFQMKLAGDVGDRAIEISVPIHVGVWPPPDFDEEEKKAQSLSDKGAE
jgi:hypothetical protein